MALNHARSIVRHLRTVPRHRESTSRIALTRGPTNACHARTAGLASCIDYIDFTDRSGEIECSGFSIPMPEEVAMPPLITGGSETECPCAIGY
jgi:hypothetical protein